jgi:hypothetical protein
MGSIETRLTRLEDISQERAVAELCRIWGGMTDEEIAVFLVPYAEWVPDSEPTPKENEVSEKTQAAMPEELIARAIGFTEGMEDEEIDQRIGNLVRRLGIFERGSGIRRHMLSREGVQ